jgi:phage terminase small subunit
MATKKPKKELLDPRQALFLEYYLTPGTETFSNIYQSAIKAGYSEEYAENFRKNERKWVSDSVGTVTKDELVHQAKKNLKELLVTSDEKIKADITKFVAKTDVEFSEKTDVTSNGKEIQPLLVKFIGDDTENN